MCVLACACVHVCWHVHACMHACVICMCVCNVCVCWHVHVYAYACVAIMSTVEGSEGDGCVCTSSITPLSTESMLDMSTL